MYGNRGTYNEDLLGHYVLGEGFRFRGQPRESQITELLASCSRLRFPGVCRISKGAASLAVHQGWFWIEEDREPAIPSAALPSETDHLCPEASPMRIYVLHWLPGLVSQSVLRDAFSVPNLFHSPGDGD